MTKIIKRERKDSAADLVSAIDELNPLLAEQGEDDAVAHLKKASGAEELTIASCRVLNLARRMKA